MTPVDKPRKAERSERESMSEMETPTHESPAVGASDGKRQRAAAVGRGPGSRKEDWIANQLRRVYDGAAEEAIPSQMLDLLKALDESGGGERE